MPRTTSTNADQQHAYLERRFNISVAGRQLEALYLTGISVDRLTIVFLHEGLGSVSLWRDFPQRGGAATGCSALIYSRHGYGSAAQIHDGGANQYCECMAAIFRRSPPRELSLGAPPLPRYAAL